MQNPPASNWYVITGGPCAGKSTLIDGIQSRGHRVYPEIARLYIDEELAKGRSLEDIRIPEHAFQNAVFDRKVALEQELSPLDHIFFDRGIPDSIAYLRSVGMEPPEEFLRVSARCPYAKIFILDLPPYKKDYARIENEETRAVLHKLLGDVYREFGFDVIQVPIFETKEARIDFVLGHIESL